MGADLATAAPCDVQIRDAVGTSELHPVAHAVAVRYVKRPPANHPKHRAKIQPESRRWPAFARRAAAASKTADARSLGVARRAGRAARRAEPARVVTIHVYTRLEKPAPDARRTTRRDAQPTRADPTKRNAVRYLRAAALAF